jgi:hypothetical protein
MASRARCSADFGFVLRSPKSIAGHQVLIRLVLQWSRPKGARDLFIYDRRDPQIRDFQVRKGDRALSGEQAHTFTSSEFAVCHGRAAVRRPGIGGPTNCERLDLHF